MNLRELVASWFPMARHSTVARIPEPFIPDMPGILFNIRTTPCSRGGMKPHISTGTFVSFMVPSPTPITRMTSGS